MKSKQHEQDYLDRKCIDCPYCSNDFPEHSCRNCYSEISQKTCWKHGGYCSICYTNICVELPKVRTNKKQLGVKCQCDNPTCAKCLSANCQDDNCPTHTLELKNKYKNRTHAKSR